MLRSVLKNILCVGSTSALTQTKAPVLNKPLLFGSCPTLLSRAQVFKYIAIEHANQMKGNHAELLCGLYVNPWTYFLCVLFHEHMPYALFYLLKLPAVPSNPLLLDTAGPVAMAADSHSFSFHLHCKALPLSSMTWKMNSFMCVKWGYSVKSCGHSFAKILTFSMCIMKPCDAPHSHTN